MELVHKQPVRWTHERIVMCDGGGGPTGHPKVYINTDKPEIAVCTYCGAPFVRRRSSKPAITSLKLTSITGS
jgi:NADH dehydrogenase (ubiquinone) Fe-S protein 6